MLTKFAVIALGAGIALGAFSMPAAGQSDAAVVAEINGRKITATELEQKEADKLLDAKYKYYVVEREALNQFIDGEILEMQAKKEGVTLDELFKRHVSSNIPEPTEEQLRFYFEGVQTDETYESARPHIIDTVHQLRLKKARDAYIADLRGQYGVVVELNQPSAQVEAGKSPRLGPESAPVQVIEYADYECPYCQKVNPDLIRLRAEFGDRVSVVYKDFALPMHPMAAKAAEAAQCAGDQGKFWEFHDALFQNKRLQTSDLKEEASALKLDSARFDKCLDKSEKAEAVKKDGLEARALGLTGTPSFFINGHYMSGAIGFAKLKETVTQELVLIDAKKQNVAMTPLPEKGEEKSK